MCQKYEKKQNYNQTRNEGKTQTTKVNEIPSLPKKKSDIKT